MIIYVRDLLYELQVSYFPSMIVYSVLHQLILPWSNGVSNDVPNKIKYIYQVMINLIAGHVIIIKYMYDDFLETYFLTTIISISTKILQVYLKKYLSA